MKRTSSSNSPRMPSMSLPRWVWASKISAPSGSSRRSSSSKSATSAWAFESSSSTAVSVRTVRSGGSIPPAVPDVLILADTTRSPELRHEVPVTVPDPFLYVERNGDRHVVISPLEVERVQGHEGLQPHPYEKFGWDELVAQGLPMEEVELETYVRACKDLGVQDAVVPPTFPLEVADRLRENGIQVRADRDVFVQRRRVKT